MNELNIGIDISDRKLSALLYADDIALLAKSEDDLQLLLNKLGDWCKRWRVLINTNKSKCVHFRKSKCKQTDYNFMIGRNKLEVVDQYKYLGVIFTFNGNFTTTAEALSKGAGRALGKIISNIHSFKEIEIKSFEKLFYSCVVPILDYTSGVWGNRKFQAIENIQNRSIRYFLGVHRFAPLLGIYGDIGWIPCHYRHWTNIVRLWNRLVQFDDNRITKQAFNHDYEKCRNNWCSDFKDILMKLGIVDYFERKDVISMTLFESILKEHYNCLWKNDIVKTPKLRTYVKLKANFGIETYVKLNLNKTERSFLTQLRCGILPLRLETGSYSGEQPNERLCKFCNSNSMEDECHFILHCSLYNDLRESTFNDIFSGNELIDMTNDEKIIFLMTNYPRKLAKYTVKAFRHRREVLYNT